MDKTEDIDPRGQQNSEQGFAQSEFLETETATPKRRGTIQQFVALAVSDATQNLTTALLHTKKRGKGGKMLYDNLQQRFKTVEGKDDYATAQKVPIKEYRKQAKTPEQLELWKKSDSVEFHFRGKNGTELKFVFAGTKNISKYMMDALRLFTAFKMQLAIDPEATEFIINIRTHTALFYNSERTARRALHNAHEVWKCCFFKGITIRDDKRRNKWVWAPLKNEPLITGEIGEIFEKEKNDPNETIEDIREDISQLKGSRRTGEIRITKNMAIPWKEVARNYVSLPNAFFDRRLSLLAQSIFILLFEKAGENKEDLKNKGYYVISTQAIQTRVALPALGDTRHPQRDTQLPTCDALEQIQEVCDYHHGKGAMKFEYVVRERADAPKELGRCPGEIMPADEAKLLSPKNYSKWLLVRVTPSGEVKKIQTDYAEKVEAMRAAAEEKRKAFQRKIENYTAKEVAKKRAEELEKRQQKLPDLPETATPPPETPFA